MNLIREILTASYKVHLPFDKPFDKLTVLSKVEGFTVLSKVEGLMALSKVEGQRSASSFFLAAYFYPGAYIMS